MNVASNVAKWLEEAVALHQAGRLSEADQLYGRILKQDPANPDALNLKGLIAAARDSHTEALRLYDRTIAVLSSFPDAHFNKGLSLAALGHLDEALASYREAVRLNPTHADAQLNVGIVLHSLGRQDEALATFRTMAVACPQDARAFYNLGYCLVKGQSLAPEAARAEMANEAVVALSRARTLDCDNADIHLVLADAHALRGEYAQAGEALRAALNLARNWTDARRAETLSSLGENLRKQQRYREAVATHREAVALSPNQHLIRFNLAAALYDAGHLDEAEALYKDVVAREKNFARALVNLGNIYRDKNRPDEAISLFERALSVEPTTQAYANIAATMTDMGWMTSALMLHNKAISLGPMDAATRYNRALTLLNMGRFETGWGEHEARFDVAHVGTTRLPSPEWDGANLADKKILIWTEQGVGDQILHASMIAEVIARAQHVLIECVGRLAPVFARSFPTATVIGRQHPTTPATPPDAYDVQIAAGSLGQHLRPDFGSFPRDKGYLKADPAKRATLRKSYETLAGGRRIVGVAWRSRNPRVGSSKSAELINFRAVLETPGIMFVNLQYGDCTADLARVCAELGVDIFSDPNVDSVVDMESFFAQVAAMDSVITTSNTAVHVAGSQGIPTWLLLPHGKGTMWYWFQHRTDSPWYPAVRIVRAQDIRMDHPWEIEPVGQVAGELAQWAIAARKTPA